MCVIKYFNFKSIQSSNEFKSGQSSSEMILLLGFVFIIVLIVIHIYNSYLTDFSNLVNENELSLINQSLSNISLKFSYL